MIETRGEAGLGVNLADRPIDGRSGLIAATGAASLWAWRLWLDSEKPIGLQQVEFELGSGD
jgi:hypothetical protein